jgi:hypothetical protein
MIEWIENIGRKKAYLILFAITLTIALLVSFYVNYKVNHFEHQGHIYEADRFEDRMWHITSDTGDTIIVSSKRGTRSYSLFSDITINIGEDTYRFYKDDGFTSIVELNNEVIEEYSRIITKFDEPKKTSIHKQFIDNVLETVSNKQYALLFYFIMFNLIMIAMGCFNIVNPEFSWHMRMMFVTRGGEPTDFYLAMTIISGMVIIAFGILYPFKML